MLDLTQIFSQLWFFIPILLIALIFNMFFKKLSHKAKRKRYKELMEKNKKKGNEYERKCGNHYEKLGYEVIYNGIVNDKKDGGIDLICKKNNEIKILVQCKNYNEEKSINHENIKVFHSNATKFMDINNLDKKRIELKYNVPHIKVFESSAIKIFKDRYYNCRYEII